MTPREAIARALFHADVNGIWEDMQQFHAEYFTVADAVIDALQKMPVTEAMQEKAFKWEGSDDHVAVLWRAMVGAMRDE